jgi:hypothetical protein
MALDERPFSGAQVKGWHMLAHAVAFCAAATLGAILIYSSYPRFEAQPTPQ